MNILIALHSSIDSNSGIHVLSIANELVKYGHSITIAALSDKESKSDSIKILSHGNVLTLLANNRLIFTNNNKIDIFYAWTPRKCIFKLYKLFKESFIFKTVIHYEDNEDLLREKLFGSDIDLNCVDNFPDSLTHPILEEEFKNEAHGFTIIIDKLKEMIPINKEYITIWPSADDSIFYPRSTKSNICKKYNIIGNPFLIVYTGASHNANFEELRSLYLGVNLINESGINVKLIRTGHNYCDYGEEYTQWAYQNVINLGYINSRKELGDITSASDIFVQPGKPGPFNDFRFPSKLPEFFATGKPVIIPKTNIGLKTIHLKDAFVVDEVNAEGIYNAVRLLYNDKILYKQLSIGAREFYMNNLSWHSTVDTLNKYLHQINTIKK
jgi:glycosyltransferase involved in cell wall biosynthesis